MNALLKGLLLSLIALYALPSLLAAPSPPELREAERKYSDAVQRVLQASQSNFEAQVSLQKLNESFVRHLEKLELQFLAKNPEAAKTVSARLATMKSKLDPKLSLAEMDGRLKGEALKGLSTPMPKASSDAPFGQFTDPREGIEIKVGDYLVLEGRTRHIPKGHRIRLLAKTNWGGIFPADIPKESNRRFTVRVRATTSFLGDFEAYLFALPETLGTEINEWYLKRKAWEEGGFKPEDIPTLRGEKTKQLNLDKLATHGAIKLATYKCRMTDQ